MWVWVDFRGRPPWNNWASSFLRGNNSMSSWILPCYWCWFWCWWFLTIHSLCMCQIYEAPDSVCSVNNNGWACSPSSMLHIVKRRCNRICISRVALAVVHLLLEKRNNHTNINPTQPFHLPITPLQPQQHPEQPWSLITCTWCSLQSQTHPCSYHHRFTITPAADGW